jgi:hypothetical protein
MERFHQHTTVDVPLEQAFAFLADARNEGRWREDIEVELVSGEPGVEGARFRRLVEEPGPLKTRRVEFELAVVEPGRRLDFRDLDGRMTIRFRFEPDGDRTKLTYERDFAGRGLGSRLKGLFLRAGGGLFPSIMRGELGRIKAALGAPAPEER